MAVLGLGSLDWSHGVQLGVSLLCNIQDGNMRMVRAQPCWWASLPQLTHLWLLERFLHWLQCEELMLFIGSCLRYFSCCIPEEKFPALTCPVLISFHQQSCSQGGWCCHTHSKEGCEEVWWGRHCFYFLIPLFLIDAILWWVDSEDDLMSRGVCRNFLPISSRKEVSGSFWRAVQESSSQGMWVKVCRGWRSGTNDFWTWRWGCLGYRFPAMQKVWQSLDLLCIPEIGLFHRAEPAGIW